MTELKIKLKNEKLKVIKIVLDDDMCEQILSTLNNKLNDYLDFDSIIIRKSEIKYIIRSENGKMICKK